MDAFVPHPAKLALFMRGITATEAARFLQCHRVHLTQALNRKRPFSPRMQQGLCKLLNERPEVLFAEEQVSA